MHPAGQHPFNPSFRGDLASREFPMTDKDFEFIRKLAHEHTGIVLTDHKREMIYSRIVRRIRALKLKSFDDYCNYLQSHVGEELTHFINAITTNLTSFFRETHHFEFLRSTVFPELKQKRAKEKRVRGWSAGCSTGEEPYSIAITMAEAFDSTWDAKLLATDLDSNVLAHAQTGLYVADRVNQIDDQRQQKWFTQEKQPTASGSQQDNLYRVKPSLQTMLSFKQLNLLGDWPMKGPFDFIFCRNVVIYFSKETQRILFDRYANMLSSDGYLFIGHSESLHGVTNRFESLGKTIYRKKN